ncbi:hypothetical protein FRC02_000078 [Tulasnella sp. 418]|nr:hypothetical protein FRC02_000078 [Tulasnella sp. 418]
MSKPPSPKRARLEPLPDAESESVPTLEVKNDPSESVDETMTVQEGASRDLVAEVVPDLTVQENWITLKVSHSGKEHTVELADSDRVYDLKEKLYTLTSVPFERQKILGLVKGKLPDDEAVIRDLKLVNGKKFQLIGTPVGQEFKELSELNQPDVLNDLDIDFSANYADAVALMNDIRNARKIKEAARKLNITLMNPLRPGKKLLVLDLDYTILDTKPLTSGALPPAECARPGLHEFLEAVYPYYDIAIWSQTSWIWLETKLVELQMVGSDKNYKISFVLDKTPMFTVFSTREGKRFTHSVKALKIIWLHFPEFGPSNTIHIDDLGRNFALNPREGLKISAFKNCHTESSMQDRELEKLSRYLVHLGANVDDFKSVDHKNWKKTVALLPPPQPPSQQPPTPGSTM